MHVSLDIIAPDQAPALADQMVRVYDEAFSGPPYYKEPGEVASFAYSFSTQPQREGFRLVGAFEDRPRRLVGFAYGFTDRPGQWWHEQVAQVLAPEKVEEWITGSFELVELAVTPRARGRGVGSRLHDLLLGGVSHARAVLSTLARETVASHLYRRRGWITLIDAMYFPGVTRPYRIMGLDLKARRAAEASQ